MEININFLAVGVSSVLAMVIGGVWYGPLFGKKWAQIIGTENFDEEARKKMQDSAKPLYVVQFLLTLFQSGMLAFLMQYIDPKMATIPALVLWLVSSFTLWATFVMPTIAGSVMWNNDSARIAWTRFFIQAGYQLVIFVMFAVVLGLWR